MLADELFSYPVDSYPDKPSKADLATPPLEIKPTVRITDAINSLLYEVAITPLRFSKYSGSMATALARG